MSEKKITVKLTDKSEEYLYELMYSLDKGDGKSPTISECINWALEAHSDFEQNSGEDLISYLQNTYGIYSTNTESK